MHNRDEVTRTVSTGVESAEIRAVLNTIADETGERSWEREK